MSDRSKMMLAWPVAGFFVVIAFGVGLIAEAAFGGSTVATQTVAAAASDAGETVDVTLGDLFIKPAKITAPAGATLNVTNEGQVDHNFAISGGPSTPMIAPGDSETLDLGDLKPGTYDFICAVPGHAESGMKGTLVVQEGGAASSTGSAAMDHGSHSGHAMMTPQQMADVDAAVTSKFPAKTKGVGLQELEPTIEPDGIKVFELTADEVKWEVEPGKFVDAYAYNGMVPGPTIKAELDDRVKIVLHNKLAEPTTIHHHGLIVPADMDGVPVISQDAVMPGKSFTYEFTVRNTGSHMYHSHFMADQQVPKGLLGAFIVPDPKDPKVDQDMTMVLNDGPLGYTLNGKSFPATSPIAAKRGDLVRIRYMNEGFQIHPMHLHGMPQEVIAIDGYLLDEPYTADTVMVAPGQRVDVLVEATEPGAWAFHCHILNHAESARGMFGMVTAMVVQ